MISPLYLNEIPWMSIESALITTTLLLISVALARLIILVIMRVKERELSLVIKIGITVCCWLVSCAISITLSARPKGQPITVVLTLNDDYHPISTTAIIKRDRVGRGAVKSAVMRRYDGEGELVQAALLGEWGAGDWGELASEVMSEGCVLLSSWTKRVEQMERVIDGKRLSLTRPSAACPAALMPTQERIILHRSRMAARAGDAGLRPILSHYDHDTQRWWTTLDDPWLDAKQVRPIGAILLPERTLVVLEQGGILWIGLFDAATGKLVSMWRRGE